MWIVWRSPKIFRLLIIGLFSLMLSLFSGLSSQAQIPAPDLSSSPTQSPPPNVKRIGDLEVTTVTLHGQDLFEIASEVVINRQEPGEQIPVEVRAQRIQERLRFVISLTHLSPFDEKLTYSTVFDPDSLNISVSTLNGQPVLMARDARRTEPQMLLTVTPQDAEHNGISQDDLAQKWRDRLQTALEKELEARQPEALWRWVRFALGIGALLLGFSALSWLLYKKLSRRKRTLKERQQDESPDRQTTENATKEIDPLFQLELLESLQQYLDLEQRLRWIDFFRWLIVWTQIIVWIGGIALIMDELPLVQMTAQDVLLSPLMIFLVWGAAGLINRLLDLGINRVATLLRTQDVLKDLQRRSLRITTLANVMKGLTTFLVYLIAVLFIFELLGFSTRSVLAFGAILGFAISLATQNLIRDLVNGFLILLEDQFAIGDVIVVDEVDGFVENLNLRTTQLRNGEGRLIVLPNSLINRVENLTRTWARVDHTIKVAVETDPHKALEVIRTVAREFYEDPEWRSLMVDPPEVLGIDDVSHDGLLIRTWIKTQPLQQWAVGREFRLRLKTALDAHGIAIGMPQQRFSTFPPSMADSNGKSADPHSQSSDPAETPPH